MTTYIAPGNLPVPNASDPADGPGAFLPLAQRLSLVGAGAGIGYAATNSVRTSLQSPDPVSGLIAVFRGLMVYDAQDDVIYKWNGTGWDQQGGVTNQVFAKATSTTIASATSFAVATGMTALLDHGLWTQSAGVFTCVIPGTYRVELVIEWAANATGQRGAALASTAKTGTRTRQETPISAGLTLAQAVPFSGAFVNGDTLSPTIQQNSGGVLGWTGELSFARLF